jgi:hypothetical protein
MRASLNYPNYFLQEYCYDTDYKEQSFACGETVVFGILKVILISATLFRPDLFAFSVISISQYRPYSDEILLFVLGPI